jgi:uncharacterized membrane protein
MDKISTSEKGRIPGKEGVMGEVIKVLDWLLENLVQICTVVLELFGIIVLVSTAVSCFVQWIRNKRQLIRLNLAQGIALALEFKMGGEVLRTVVVREWSELGILGASGNAYIFDSLGDQERKKRNPGRARRKARVKRGTKKGVCRMSGLPFFVVKQD